MPETLTGDPWDGDDVEATLVTDENVKAGADAIGGGSYLEYYSYPQNDDTQPILPNYVITTDDLVANHTYYFQADFTEADDIQDAYLFTTSQQDSGLNTTFTESELN